MLKQKPVGSEKLEGKEKLQRILELTYKGLNESKEDKIDGDFLVKEGVDGKNYAIVKENSHYFIKISDSKENLLKEDFQYIGGVRYNQKYKYNSFADALKGLNTFLYNLKESLDSKKEYVILENDKFVLRQSIKESKNKWIKINEFGSYFSVDDNNYLISKAIMQDGSMDNDVVYVSCFADNISKIVKTCKKIFGDNIKIEDCDINELLSENDKFVLRQPEPQTPPQQTTSAPAPQPQGEQFQEPQPEPMEDVPMDEPQPSFEDDEDSVIRQVQRLTGKLGQKIRDSYNSQEGFDDKMVKYVMNSIISAIRFENVNPQVKESLVNRINQMPEQNQEVPQEQPPVQGEPQPQMQQQPMGESEEITESKKGLPKIKIGGKTFLFEEYISKKKLIKNLF